jgi:predicted RNase H-like HicB family nuclease
MKFTVIIEEGKNSYGAYVPDIPGMVAVAKTKDEVLDLIRSTLKGHLVSLQADGMEIPRPKSDSKMIEV